MAQVKRALATGVSIAALGLMTGMSMTIAADLARAQPLDWIDITNAPNSSGGPVSVGLSAVEEALQAFGRTGTAYGAMRLDDSYPIGLALTVGGGLFGTAAEADAAIAAQRGWSGTGDGYAAIANAIDTYGGAFRADTSRLIAFGSAEPDFSGNASNVTRQVVDPTVTAESIVAQMRANNIKLFAFVDSQMQSGADRVLAVLRNADSSQYTIARVSGGQVVFENTADISGLFPEGRTAYTDIALESYGAIMDRSAAGDLAGTGDNPIPAITDAILTNLAVNEEVAAESELQSSSIVNNRVSTRRLVGVMSGRVSSLLLSGQPVVPFVDREDIEGGQDAAASAARPTGLAGGDGEGWYVGKLGVWADAAGSLYRTDDNAASFWGHQYSVMGGADYRIGDEALAGASLGYERIEVDFKSGRERTVDYVFATIYGAHLLGETLSVDALASYGLGFNTMTEAANLTGDGEHDTLSHRFVAASSLSYNDVVAERVTLFGSGGISYSHEIIADYETEAGATVSPDDARLGQLHASGEVGYLLEYGDESRLQPFATVRLEYDYINSAGGDRFGTLVGGGLRAQISPAFSLEAFGNTELARSDADSTSFGLTARFQF